MSRSESKPNQWMPLHIDDFLSRTARISTEDKGAYLMLLMNYWRNQEPLPNDDYALANIAGLSVDQWKTISPRVLSFFTVKGESLHNKRMDHEIEKATGIVAKRREAGKRGGQASSNSRSKKEAIATANASPKSTASVNTRACKGQQGVASQDSPAWIPDFETVEVMNQMDESWASSPEAVHARADARKFATRGVA